MPQAMTVRKVQRRVKLLKAKGCSSRQAAADGFPSWEVFVWPDQGDEPPQRSRGQWG
jgi:hypothetical protein